jgi:L-fucose isomerase-like protein
VHSTAPLMTGHHSTCLLMGFQWQRQNACGVVACHQRSLLNSTVPCQTISLMFIRMMFYEMTSP